MTEGLLFRFCETPPDIALCRVAERRTAALRHGLGYPAPCTLRVSESKGGTRMFHVWLECDLGRTRGKSIAEASAGSAAAAAELAFDRLQRRVLPAATPLLLVSRGG